MNPLNRRHFLGLSVALPFAIGFAKTGAKRRRIFFTAGGRIACIDHDGAGLEFLDFNKPGQATWQTSAFFEKSQKMLVLSMEPRRDGPGKPFQEYYTQTPTHIWSYDLANQSLTELATQNRLAVFYTPSLLLANGRMLVQVSTPKSTQIFNINLDGSDPMAFTQPEDGVPYGFNLSPDFKKVAFHIAGPEGYQIFTSDTDGRNRVKIIGNAGHLYFGPSWSPDGHWILYADCREHTDPGHDWADVCISRTDGSEHRMLTSGQEMWFAATYGNHESHGGGSNLPVWTKDGEVIFPKRLSGSKVPWEYQAEKVDTDHFNREFKPDQAIGGVGICRINIETKKVTILSKPGNGYWDFRASPSQDGRYIVFCRAKTGGVPSLWIVDSDGENERMLTGGLDGKGVDHPKWAPA